MFNSVSVKRAVGATVFELDRGYNIIDIYNPSGQMKTLFKKAEGYHSNGNQLVIIIPSQPCLKMYIIFSTTIQ